MKKIHTLILLLLLSLAAYAQTKAYKGDVNITPLRIEQKGDSLYISLDFDMSQMTVSSNKAVIFRPVLQAASTQITLPRVIVRGKGNFLMTKRSVALMSESERETYQQNKPYAVLKGYKSKDYQNRLRYTMTLPFKGWMGKSELLIREDFCGCCRSGLAETSRLGIVKMEPAIQPYLIKPALDYVQPEAEIVKQREMVGEAFLDFTVSKTDIRPDYMNNPRELKKITDMMADVKNDRSISVTGILIEGYASPEGTLKFNQYLSENRAKALVQYLKPKFEFSSEMYRILFGGENWEELKEAVSTSNMECKDEILAILRDTSISDVQRKNKLKRLRKGETYAYMVKHYYPSLRKAMCKINFVVQGFDVLQAKEVFKTRPQNLSLNEMYLVANTFEIGSPEFVNVFEMAAKLYPNDNIANLNAATAALERGNIEVAETYLSKVSLRTAQYYNAMGVTSLFKEEYDSAENMLTKAMNLDSRQASKNLEQLKLKKENIQQINLRKERLQQNSNL